MSGYEFNLFKNKLNLKSIKKFVYLIHADIKDYNSNHFLVYQGPYTNSSFIFFKAQLLLPSSTYFEKNCTYINLEGRYRICKKVITPFSLIYNDFEIIQGLNLIKINKISLNFSIIEKFNEILLIFKEIINYDCIFFFTRYSFLNKMKKLF